MSLLDTCDNDFFLSGIIEFCFDAFTLPYIFIIFCLYPVESLSHRGRGLENFDFWSNVLFERPLRPLPCLLESETISEKSGSHSRVQLKLNRVELVQVQSSIPTKKHEIYIFRLIFVLKVFLLNFFFISNNYFSATSQLLIFLELLSLLLKILFLFYIFLY